MMNTCYEHGTNSITVFESVCFRDCPVCKSIEKTKEEIERLKEELKAFQEENKELILKEMMKKNALCEAMQELEKQMSLFRQSKAEKEKSEQEDNAVLKDISRQINFKPPQQSK